MTDTLGTVIQDPPFGTGEHSIKYGYVSVFSKQQEKDCHSLLLVGSWQCLGYLGAPHVRHPNAVISECFIRHLEAFSKVNRDLTVVLVYSRLGASSSTARLNTMEQVS